MMPMGGKFMAKEPKGRLVLNHSTHIPGLIKVLERLVQIPEITTVTPAVIGRVRSHAPQFRLKVSVPIRGGFKLIARKAKVVQEVFVLTTLDQAQLQDVVKQVLKSVRL